MPRPPLTAIAGKALALLMALLPLATLPAMAQSEANDNWPDLLCPISAVKTLSPGEYDLQLHCGSLDGIAPASRTGPLLRRHRPGVQEGALAVESEVALKAVRYLDSQVRLSLDPALPTPRSGDLVPLEIVSGPLPDRTLFQLSRLAILFTSQDGTPWVLYRDYRSLPDFDFEAARMPLMLNEIIEMAEQANAVYNSEPLSEGAFAGQTLAEAMRGSSLGDLRDFFAFVKAFPGKYIGQSWKLPEVYATWIINGAPGPEDEETETIPDPIPADDSEQQLGTAPAPDILSLLRQR